MLPFVFITLRERRDWLLYCASAQQAVEGEVTVPGNGHVVIGDTVNVEVRFVREGMVLMSAAVVTARHASRTGRLGGTVSLRFLNAQRSTLELISRFAHGDLRRQLERSEQRFPVALTMEYGAWHDVSGHPFARGLTRDISKTGVFLRTESPLAAGTVVNLKFRPPERSAPVAMRGIVVWKRDAFPMGMGVRFVFDRPAARAAIDACVGRLSELVDRARSAAQVAAPA